MLDFATPHLPKNINQKPNTGALWAAKVHPRPIRTVKEHRAALDELMRLGRLMDAGAASRDQADTAEVLTLLVTDYERRRFGEISRRSTPLERLRYLVEESGLSASDLGRLLGDRALGSRLLSGQRELSKAHIRRLAEHFRLEPGYFI